MNRAPRPLSPFMIGPYYRPQLTSMTSIAHRLSGALLVLGLLAWALWLVALAFGPSAALSAPMARLALWLFAVATFYHLANGIRHLFWDAGLGLDLATAYRSGWAVVGATVLFAVVSAAALLGVLP